MSTTTPIRILAAALALAIAGGTLAQSPSTPAAAPAAPTTSATPADLAAKRAEMARLQREMQQLGQRMGELAREMGEPSKHIVMQRSGPPRIGLGVVLGEAANGGARIAAVTPGGPADKAGLKAGDVLRSAHGKTIDDPRDLVEALRGIQSGQAVNVGYLRDGRSASAAVVAGELPGRMAFDWAGDRGQHATRALERVFRGDEGHKHVHVIGENPGQQDVRVVTRGGPGQMQVFTCINGEGDCDARVMHRAFRFSGLNLTSIDADLGRYFGTDDGVLLIAKSDALPGLKSGDVITAVAGQPVDSPRDVMRALRDKDAGERLSLRILRNRAAQDVTVTVPEGEALDFLPPLPPMPPAPPAPPTPPAPPVGAAPTPAAAPPAPPAPPADASAAIL